MKRYVTFVAANAHMDRVDQLNHRLRLGEITYEQWKEGAAASFEQLEETAFEMSDEAFEAMQRQERERRTAPAKEPS